MAARAIWKGVLRVGGQQVPVKLYSAIEDRTVRFRLLHSKDHAPVKQAMVEAETDDVVPNDNVVRGFFTDEGDVVLIDKEELETLEPEASRDIDIEYFVPPGTIAYRHYLRPYLLGPDGDEQAYKALTTALEDTNQEGFARWVMRKKQYIGSLTVYQGYLMLVTLRHRQEVVDLDSVQAPKGKTLDDRELKMAAQLVEMLADDFDASAYHDDYREQVMDLIETKAKGGKVKTLRPKKKKPTDDLSKALEASLKASKNSTKPKAEDKPKAASKSKAARKPKAEGKTKAASKPKTAGKSKAEGKPKAASKPKAQRKQAAERNSTKERKHG